ncbi:MAG: hypothetical protein JRN21_06370 [Nitrososphaerota archaeon]|nr:hypothetical protein [Nitrososphaerota archaeon]
MKVYIGCFGSGLGHASRMLELARQLTARGAELEFSSSGEVASYISGRGYRCNSLPLADVKYSDNGEFQVKETLLESPMILARTYRQLALEVRNIEMFGADAVLSDSSLSTVLAGKVLRLPVFTVLNQLNLTSSNVKTGTLRKLLSVGTSEVMGRSWEFSDAILIPDLPPPYTISERNLWGSKVEKVRYVGFLSSTEDHAPDAAAEELAGDPRPKVFWQVSGPPRTRSPLLRAGLRIAEELKDRYVFVVSGGDPQGAQEPRRIGGGWYYEWCPLANFYFESCDAVVSRAGHGTIGQSITSMKPSLLVPIPNQPEQEGNAEKASKLGVSIMISQDQLTTDVLARSLAALLGGEYKRKTSSLGRYARGFDATSAIVGALQASTLAGRGPR